MRRTIAIAALGAVTVAGCAKDASRTDTAAGASAAGASTAAAATARKLGETANLKVPESVRYDPELDVYFISNINGNPSQKDNNGFIARVRADSTGSAATMLVEGGKNGVTLNAPKGMALRGDTLYVADIDAVRMFNRRTGASLGSIDLRGQKATFLNDVAVGPDGVYVTDTGIRFDAKGGMTHPGVNRIFKIAGKTVTEAAKGDSLGNPNGIAWDAANNRFVLAPFGSPNVQTWSAGQAAPTNMLAGPGQYDGIEVVPQGILVSSWADSAVHIIHGGTHMATLVSNVSAPADIGVDTKRNVVAIPRFNDGKVEYYSIP